MQKIIDKKKSDHFEQNVTSEDPAELVKDGYALSPLQEGMLIHSLADQGVGMYISQGVHAFDYINVDAMEQAWQMVVDRHEVLRTSFIWENLEAPLQLVHKEVDVKFKIIDFQEFASWEQKIKLREFLWHDRNKGFDLSRAPLFRLFLVQRSEKAYYLVFSHHHLLLDGWSNPILLDEVRTFYQAFLREEKIFLPQPKPFRHYIQWLRQHKLSNEKKFWQEYLLGIDRPTPLPYDLGAHRQAGYPLKSEEWPLEIKENLFSALQKTARSCHVTLNTLIQAAWSILLSRYSGQKHVSFGTLVSGRTSALQGIENMIGMFLNTLPMHVEIKPNVPLKEWLKYLHAQQNALHEHEFCPLNLIQQWSDLPRGTNLFDSVIDTNNTHQPQDEVDDMVMAPINQSVPLLLFAKPATRKLVLILVYNNRRFVKTDIIALGEQLITLFTSMCDDFRVPIGELSMLSEAENQKTTLLWNETKIEYPHKSTMHQLFEGHATVTPTATAVNYLDKSYSYRDLNQKANQLAHHLREIGITEGAFVGFCLDRSLDMVIVILAILKSGAGYVPLDPNYPLERLQWMLTNSGAKLLITQEKWLEGLAEIVPAHLCVDLESATWEQQKRTNLSLDLNPENIAYILYTSGSTGVPKGIVIPHRVTVNRMFIEFDPFESGETLCAKTSISFVDSVWELWSAWCNGLAVTLIPEDHIKDPHKLLETLARTKATRIVLVPSLLRSMLDSESELESKLPHLKHWICSGEALPGDLSKRFVREVPNAILTNLYGATEIWDATRCDTRDELPYETMPIGKPMGNMQGYILDDEMRPVPIGIVGEIHFSGAHVAHGYWKRPDLTARQFIPNPFSREPGQRLYKTGDLGRWLPDGNIEYLGRRDQQIKLRGFRIELGEIESVIRQHPAISQAAVTVSDDERLVAYIVTEEDPGPTSAELRVHARTSLPEHMTPAFYLALADIPLTPNGKTDRRRLPKPKAEDLKRIVEQETISRQPETPTEKVVAKVWAQILGLDEVGAESDFFQLGGQSLMAVRIITKLGKLLNISIPLSILMDTRTVADLAGWIDNSIAQGIAAPLLNLPELTRVDHGKKAPLSFAQQQMWFLYQLNPGSTSYTLPNLISFPVQIDVEALKEALAEVIRRHETLRTTFAAIDGKPFQVINDVETVTLKITDLSHLPTANRDKAIKQQIAEQIRMAWDLHEQFPFRYQLLKLAEDNFVLVMTLHHIATDGRSMGILANEIQVLYKTFKEGLGSLLKELPLQYADYAIWQRDWLKGEQLEEHLNYWKKQLDDASYLELPLDHVRPAVQRYRGGHYSIWLDEAIVHGMRALALEEGATVFMALLALFQLLLARYSGQDDICVGTPTANRFQPQLEQLIGYFVNTLVIRTRIEGNPTFRDLINMVRINCLQAYDHQEVPFEKVVDALGVQRDLDRNPLFQVLFVHQILSSDEDTGESRRQQGPEQETSNFDLVLNAQESMNQIECKFIYNSDLFDIETIERMGAHLQLMLSQCVSAPDKAISQSSMLFPAERQQILKLFSLQGKQPLENRCAHDIIAEQAHHHPAKIAVRFGNDTLTYGTLEQRANQMACHLQKLGVGPETVVGWCVERSVDILIGLLGIMKAGGVFLSLDPAYPKERLKYMLQDTGAPLVITQEKLLDHLPSDLCQVVLLDGDWQTSSDPQTVSPPCGVQPENLAYIVYTSGSTGLPKGVMVEHRNLANLIAVQIPNFNVSSESHVLQTLSLSFDAALGEIFRTLMAGATLHLAHKDDLLPGPTLINLLKNEAISSVALSAASITSLPRVSQDLPKLKNITVGGDSCSPEVVAHWSLGRRFMNGYGPTETTIGATLAVNWDSNSKPPLGPPLPNVEAYVLDRWMQPVPIGTPGELFIGGIGLSRGYLKRPDLTAASFVPNPFADKPGARLYRTGDLVRWLADGSLDFLGRIDHQVKIRGYRIELSEIEAVLSRHPNVNQAVVIVNNQKGVKRLAAYLTTKENDSKLEINALRTYLKTSLPDYMVPAFLMVCESLPMTINGKIDRKSLPEPSTDQLELEQQYVAPENDLEKLIVEIWADILGMEKTGVCSNFFELGGDSIMSIRVVARITEAGYALTLQEMFKHQTVRELADALSSGIEVLAAEQGAVTGQVPLTPVQRWFFDQEPVDPHYFNQWMAVSTPPDLNSDNMRSAVAAVLNHHDALRARYSQLEPQKWTQVIGDLSDQEIPFSSFDLSAVPDHECGDMINLQCERLHKTLNLQNGPLIGVCWFNAGVGRAGRLLIFVHHIVMDIVSWSTLVDDIMKGYRQLNEKQQLRLPVKTTSFKQWALALKDYAYSKKVLAEIPYWSALSQRQAQPLPVDSTEGDHTLWSTQTVYGQMTSSQTRELQTLVAPHFQSRFHDLLLAALAIAINRFSHNTNVCIKVEGQGREDIGIELNLSRTVGWFTSFYPVSVRINPEVEFNQQVRETVVQIEAIPNHGIGYSVLRYMNSDDAVTSRMREINDPEISFNYTGQSVSQDSGEENAHGDDDMKFWQILAGTGKIQLAESKQGDRRHLIEIVSGVMDDRLTVRFDYGSLKFSKKSIECLCSTLITTLESMITSYNSKKQSS